MDREASPVSILRASPEISLCTIQFYEPIFFFFFAEATLVGVFNHWLPKDPDLLQRNMVRPAKFAAG